MGNAAGFGPDMGKAVAAATRVFGIIEFPSKIDAQAIDEDETMTFKRIKPEDVTGKLEFKDVWFRYPTRKEDFVLKGLNQDQGKPKGYLQTKINSINNELKNSNLYLKDIDRFNEITKEMSTLKESLIFKEDRWLNLLEMEEKIA